jgi:hypothetical protein
MLKQSDKHSPNRTHKKVRSVAKSATDTGRQGQGQGQTFGQLARQHGVSVPWLRLIAFGTLDDPAFVQEIKKAAKDPELWALVAPAAREAVVIPTAKITRLGGSLDDVLATLFDCCTDLQDPRNRNFASQTSALQWVNTSLDFHLQARMEADAERGRRSIKSIQTAAEAKTAKAQERARKLLAEVEARRPGSKKKAVYDRIARQTKRQPASVRKAIYRNLIKPPHKT